MTIQLVSIFVGVAIFGFNPYVTNTIHRGHPFYPMLGTAAYPSLSESGQDPIERDETPHNMVGRNRFVRFAYAIFGRPGSQPFFQGENANLMWPFDIGWKDFNIFYFHEVRISGFGPLFSGALIISLFLFGMVLVRPSIPREIDNSAHRCNCSIGSHKQAHLVGTVWTATLVAADCFCCSRIHFRLASGAIGRHTSLLQFCLSTQFSLLSLIFAGKLKPHARRMNRWLCCGRTVKSRLIFSISANLSASDFTREESRSVQCEICNATTRWN